MAKVEQTETEVLLLVKIDGLGLQVLQRISEERDMSIEDMISYALENDIRESQNVVERESAAKISQVVVIRAP